MLNGLLNLNNMKALQGPFDIKQCCRKRGPVLHYKQAQTGGLRDRVSFVR
jgi:hypothetical protein